MQLGMEAELAAFIQGISGLLQPGCSPETPLKKR